MPLPQTVPLNGHPYPLLKGQSPLFDIHQIGLCCVQCVDCRRQLTAERPSRLVDREKDDDRCEVDGIRAGTVLVRRALLERCERGVC